MVEPRDTNAFLTVEEAAARLGMSRLRVREAVARGLIVSRRDNEGRLRVDLPDRQTLPSDGASDLDPDAILAFLFDDIEDLEAALAERDARIGQLTNLLARQDDALGRADAALTDAQQDKARLAEMLDRALSHLERLPALTEALERAQLQAAHGERLAGLLERAMTLAEQNDGTRAVADRSLALLEEALDRVEASQVAQHRTESLLERSMRAGEDAVRRSEQAQAQLDAREKTLETTLALSERAAALAENKTQQPRKGFLRWLLGI